MRFLEQRDDGDFNLTINFGPNVPPYAILSHTWGQDMDEVTYNDLINGTGRSKAGYTKIRFCGEQAKRDGLRYFWVDTCCINKQSSSELSEAINSMFRWYHEAAKCYVFLSDVSTEKRKRNEGSTDNLESDFRVSRWFTRGWTVQELIAPISLDFFSADGQRLGNKISMVQLVHDITRIPVRALQGDPLSDFSLAERMSWIQHRQTTIQEDKVYSLFGIFDVSMPIIYGEGPIRAFRRLQEAIRTSVSTSPKSTPTGMRLLVAQSNPLRMETVPVNDGLQYAILSHTWGDDEVSFDDMCKATAEQRRGYSKIRECCDLAAKHGFDYVWVDTCCIDKSSSSELQEAICFMYKWYKNAVICYVYLEDYKHGNVGSLIECRWFTRGWTLQELIAPTFVEFYDQNWNEIGTKQSLCDHIATITSIDPLVLRGANPTKRTIAERMSWAASRSTTRIEDAAYSLMGLFNVFMPMLYGEGKRAFIRLQEEIIKQTEDYTIFSWKANVSGAAHRGIFAHSPAEFAAVRSEQIIPRFSHPSHKPDQHPPPALTSRGLLLTLPVLVECSSGDNTYLSWVSCSSPQGDNTPGEPTLLCIRLREIQSTPQIFARISSGTLQSCVMQDLRYFKLQTLCVLPSTVDQSANLDIPRTGEVIIHPPHDINNVVAPMQLRVTDWAQWQDQDKKLTYSYQEGTCSLAVIRFKIEQGFVVVIGFHEDVPWCSIVTQEDVKQQGKAFDDLDILKSFSRSSERYTDRAKKMLSTTRAVTVTMRVTRFINTNVPRFGLHVTLSESTMR